MPLHQYFWSITVKVRWVQLCTIKACGMQTQEKHLVLQTQQTKTGLGGNQLSTPGYLQASQEFVLMEHLHLQIYTKKHTRLVPSCEIEKHQHMQGDVMVSFRSRGVKPPPPPPRAIKMYSPKFPFNKESENENIIFLLADGNCCLAHGRHLISSDTVCDLPERNWCVHHIQLSGAWFSGEQRCLVIFFFLLWMAVRCLSAVLSFFILLCHNKPIIFLSFLSFRLCFSICFCFIVRFSLFLSF